jgi:defect-in-organelle-trafficking protein DotA
MNKRLLALLLTFFPVLVFADTSTLNFSPPASDYSMVFLANLFGVVDGVLSGTGSQIMGAIFIVFNSAVLALGGIVIMYTLIVSTMNTAHEGQMLGQKWSSIWIPLRSTIGLALLIPKASGYCLMQIFVMWVVTQGVGAADKVWEAALGYLNRGGVIIQAQANPGSLLMASVSPSANAIPIGASTILMGQVCMLGIQKQLEAQRTLDTQPSGSCQVSEGQTVPTSIAALCSTPVPDLLSTVNFVDAQQKGGAGPYSVRMPNIGALTPDSPYKSLDGICGTVKWNAVSGLPSGTTSTSAGTLTASELVTAQLSRAIAIQQMYVDLSTVSLQMVTNDPQLTTSNNTSSTSTVTNYSLVANQQFGVPYTISGTICTVYNQDCTTWGPDSTNTTTSAGVIFNGTEFLGAMMDYNGVMMPTLNLIQEAQNTSNLNNSRSFIDQANAQGWMMAGSYFFNLVQLNGSATANSSLQDTDSGMDTSIMLKITDLNANTDLMGWLNNNQQLTMQIESLLDGTQLSSTNGVPVNQTAVPQPSAQTLGSNPNRALISAQLESTTVYAFINNSLMVQLPGQPGLQPLQFANTIHFSTSPTMYYLQPQSFSCGNVKTFVFTFCLGALLGDIFYNAIIMVIYNSLVFFFEQIIENVIMSFIMIPIQGMSFIFQDGLAAISVPGANPIIALANMGVMYINFSGNLWMGLMAMAITSALIPILGIFIFALFAFVMPLLLSWVGIMVSVGFTTAYYIPLLPYMIFTFGSIAWLISVIEAMVAAPIVALGVTHPEGHDAFGKGEAAVMLLMNVFLRPALMIIGYISAIALSYVSVWVLNSGFENAIAFIQSPSGGSASSGSAYGVNSGFTGNATLNSSGTGGYDDWAAIYGWFFSILSYTTMYLTVVQKAFTLISYLPDKVLRWIGGNPESLGSESAQWGDEMVKGKSGEASKGVQDSQAQMGKQLGAQGQKLAGAIKGKVDKAASGASVAAKGGE